jgi:predicted peptidase
MCGMMRALTLALVVAVSSAAAAQPLHGFVEREVVYTGGPYDKEVFRYRLRPPSKVEEGKSYPLILFLHGAGERGSDNKKQMLHFPELWRNERHAAAYDCFVLAPQCREGRKWVDIPWSTKTSVPLPKEPSHDMRAALLAYDKTLKEHPVDRDRIYLTGLSMGGYGAWYLAARHPDRWAAVVPVCGGGPESDAARLKDVKLWAWHGDEDRSVPVERSRGMVAAIKKAGGKPRYTELKGVGHGSWVQAYGKGGALAWMFEQAKAQISDR